MEWEETASGGRADDDIRNAEVGEERGGGDGEGAARGILCAKVMTDEQVEVLRRQIAVYAAICEQLVEMHRAFTAHQDSLAGISLGSFYCDSMVASGGHKITPRQRWCPSTKQLKMLENIFDEGNGTPSKQKIKEIARQLSQHGPISETNVYNWFQNRRARSKRKQTAPSNNAAESEAEAGCESPDEEKPKPGECPHEDHLLVGMGSHPICNAQVNKKVHLLGPELNQTRGTYHSSESSKLPDISDELSYESFLSKQRVEQLMEKMDIPGSFNPFQ